MKETQHDYQHCLSGNYYDNKMTSIFNSWSAFKLNYGGFTQNTFDDRYNFVFRYDINKQENNQYELELCIMLQRKGIYSHIYIQNIEQSELDTEVNSWLKDRFKYLKSLWIEVI